MRIGLEACGGAHYSARTLNKLGHQARIMAVKYVVPHRTKGKNDLNVNLVSSFQSDALR